jgi:hypothetical protein
MGGDAAEGALAESKPGEIDRVVLLASSRAHLRTTGAAGDLMIPIAAWIAQFLPFLRVLRLAKEDDSIPAEMLGRIQSAISRGEERSYICKVTAHSGGHANAYRNGRGDWRTGIAQSQARKAQAHGVGNSHRICFPSGGEHYPEFFSAVSRYQIRLSFYELPKFQCDPHEAFVAALMALGIVQHLEVIHIEKQQREWFGGPHQASPFTLHFPIERAAVGYTGETVNRGKTKEFIVRQPQFGGRGSSLPHLPNESHRGQDDDEQSEGQHAQRVGRRPPRRPLDHHHVRGRPEHDSKRLRD